MFEDAAEFNATNFIPRRSAQEALQDYHKHIKYEGNDLILEIGSGSGNVTADIFLPFIPHANFRLIGVDLLQHMVDFANENNKDPRLSFRVLNIKEDNVNRVQAVFTDEELNLGFNLVFSFNCLHWTNDYFQCYKNIFSLMRPGGQIFTLNVAYSTCAEIWKSIHQLEKWQPYLNSVPVFTFPYHDSKDPIKECTEMLKDIGFQDIKCYLDPHFLMPANPQHPPPPMKRVMEYMDPYLYSIPKNLRSQYMDDLMGIYDMWIKKKPGLPYDRITVIAVKPLN